MNEFGPVGGAEIEEPAYLFDPEAAHRMRDLHEKRLREEVAPALVASGRFPSWWSGMRGVKQKLPKLPMWGRSFLDLYHPKEDATPDEVAQAVTRALATATFNLESLERLAGLGIGRKMWMAHPDDRTRPTHGRAHGQLVGMNEHFLVGGYPLSYPGDRTWASPAETYNCRCVIVGVR